MFHRFEFIYSFKFLISITIQFVCCTMDSSFRLPQDQSVIMHDNVNESVDSLDGDGIDHLMLKDARAMVEHEKEVYLFENLKLKKEMETLKVSNDSNHKRIENLEAILEGAEKIIENQKKLLIKKENLVAAFQNQHDAIELKQERIIDELKESHKMELNDLEIFVVTLQSSIRKLELKNEDFIIQLKVKTESHAV